MILVVNAGSSSLKLSAIGSGGETLGRTTSAWGSDATRAGDRDRSFEVAVRTVLEQVGRSDGFRAVGHRVVHGGPRLTDAVVLDEAVIDELEAVQELAPLHNAVALDAIAAARRSFPDVPHVACFDTAFHATLPDEERRYPVPDGWHHDWGIRRYGFHGLSVAWSVEQAAAELGRAATDLLLVVAHLGSGCSVTAVAGGRSAATSMGYTPLEGLMMGTRAGSIDPGILLRLMDAGRLSAGEAAEALEHGSGLLGVSGVSGDVREVRAAAERGDARARLALAMFVSRAAAGIAAVATSLPRIDALVFTGGIGEHAADLRDAIVDRLAVMGIGRDGGPRTLVVEAREDLRIAQEAERLLG